MLGNNSDDVLALLSEVIRVGIVSSTDDAGPTVRVKFTDRDDVVSYDLSVLMKNTKKNKDYWIPEVNEQVLCLFLPNGIEQGFVLGSLYSKETLPPASSKDKRKTLFEDGTSVEYDRATHTLTVDVPASGGNVIVNAHTSVTVNSPKVDLGEPSSLEPSVLGDKLAAWITGQLKPWLDSHNHVAGPSPTSPASGGPHGPFNPGNGAAGGNVYSTKNRNQ